MTFAKVMCHYAGDWTEEEINEAIITTEDMKFLTPMEIRELKHFYKWLIEYKKKQRIIECSDG